MSASEDTQHDLAEFMAQDVLVKSSGRDVQINPDLASNEKASVNYVESKVIQLNPKFLPAEGDQAGIDSLASTLGHEWVHTVQYDDALAGIIFQVIRLDPKGWPITMQDTLKERLEAKRKAKNNCP